MPTSFSNRVLKRIANLRYFIPAAITFGVAAFLAHPLVFIVLLAANTLLLAGMCHSTGFGLETNFFRTVLRRGVAYFVLLGSYAGFVALLVTYPLLVLIREGSLTAVIILSIALVVALFSVWRIGLAFGLVFVWDDAYPDSKEHSWIFTATTRSLKFSTHLTAGHDVFFSHSLVVASSLLALVFGALSLAGLGGLLPAEFRIVALVIYGLGIAPLANALIAHRSVRALLAEARRRHRGRHNNEISKRNIEATESSLSISVPAISPENLNATLLNAARTGQIDLALVALERGANANLAPEATDRDQRPLLVLASTMTDSRLLRALIAKGAEINRVHAGLTVLLAATRDSHQGRSEVVMTLLANGADPRCTDNAQNTPLHYAALNADPTVAALLLDADAPLSAVNREALTPLGMACRAANWDLVHFFIEQGAKLDIENAQPAVLAASMIPIDDVTGVKLVLKRKAKVDARGPLGRTALMSAALHGHTTIAKTLLVAGADVNLIDHHGTTALMEAARSGSQDVIELMSAYRPLPDLSDAAGRTALMIACQSRQSNEATIKQLLALGANPQLTFSNGKRAVDLAAEAGRWTFVRLLDPTYQIPVSVAEVQALTPPGDVATPAHLLDALRFGHWSVVSQFHFLAPTWKQAELADLYLELALPEHDKARKWLLNHGIDPTASECANVLTTLISKLPTTYSALFDWMSAGASVGGAGILTRMLSVLGSQLSSPKQHKEAEKCILELVERGADFCGIDPSSGRSTLHLAVSAEFIALTCTLLDRGCNPNARATDGCTPLHGVWRLSPSTAQLLIPAFLKAGANVEAVARNNETPLGLALVHANSDIKKWLHWPQWKPPQRGLLPSDLPAAAALGDIEAVEKLLMLGLPIDATDKQGATALLHAAGSGHIELVEFLLKRGANCSLAAKSGATALSASIRTHRTAVLPLLLAHGAKVDQRLPGGGTPLILAAGLGLPEMVKSLLSHGAIVDAEDDEGCCALHRAAQFAFQCSETQRAKKTLELLIQRKVINHCNKAGQSPLLFLLGGDSQPGVHVDQKHLLALLPLFIEQGANLSLQDQRGVTVLHSCAIHGLLLPARTLLSAGANSMHCDVFDRTPAAVAQLLGYVDLAAELSDIKAPIPGPAQTLRKRLDA